MKTSTNKPGKIAPALKPTTLRHASESFFNTIQRQHKEPITMVLVPQDRSISSVCIFFSSGSYIYQPTREWQLYKRQSAIRPLHKDTLLDLLVNAYTEHAKNRIEQKRSTDITNFNLDYHKKIVRQLHKAKHSIGNPEIKQTTPTVIPNSPPIGIGIYVRMPTP